MLGTAIVLGFLFGTMITFGVLGWAVEKVAQRKTTDIIEEIRRKAEDERRAG